MGIKDTYNNIQKKIKKEYVEIPLLIQNLLYPNELDSTIKVFKISISDELKLINTLKLNISDELPLVVYEDILPSVVDTTQVNIDLLTYFDIEWIIYNSRILTNGGDMKVNLVCEHCYKETKELEKEVNKLKKEYSNVEDEEKLNEYNEKLKDLYLKYNIKDSISKQTFEQEPKKRYTFEYNIDLTKYDISNVPDEKPIEIYENSNIKLKLIPSTYYHHKVQKPFFTDDRLITNVISEFENKKVEEITEDEINRFKNLSTISLSLDSLIIDKDEYKFNEETFQMLPFILFNNFSKKQLNEILELIKNKLSSFSIKNLEEQECPVCGKKIPLEYYKFPFRYLL